MNLNEVVYDNENYRIERKKFIKYGLLIYVGILIIAYAYYFNSNLTLLYWNPFLNSLFKIFYFTFYILPSEVSEGIFTISGGGIGLPNPITIGLALLLQCIVVRYFLILVFYVSDKINIKKLIYKILVVMLIVSVFFIVLAFALSSVDQKICASNLSGNKSLLKNTGIIEADIPDFNAHFAKLNGINNFEQEDYRGITIMEVPSGNEIEKGCRLNSYPYIGRIDSLRSVRLLTENDLFIGANADIYWKHVNASVCESNQFTLHTRDDCYESVARGRGSKEFCNMINNTARRERCVGRLSCNELSPEDKKECEGKWGLNWDWGNPVASYGGKNGSTSTPQFIIDVRINDARLLSYVMKRAFKNEQNSGLLETWTLYDRDASKSDGKEIGKLDIIDNNKAKWTMEISYDTGKLQDKNVRKINIGKNVWVNYETSSTIFYETISNKYLLRLTIQKNEKSTNIDNNLVNKILSSIELY